ncbi:MAG: hypothetical protein BGO14_00335 [Chlamydiales bacterium 38-26]|nr:MAG: hypothetical protein BGO14_00335 [Chlamydiales bacterium 38-26]
MLAAKKSVSMRQSVIVSLCEKVENQEANDPLLKETINSYTHVLYLGIASIRVLFKIQSCGDNQDL